MYDLAIIGGGAVGIATAYEALRKRSSLSVLVLDKEPELALHQTGHNSGVIHSGIYYRPGSSKARNCRAGVRRLVEFCREHQVHYELCGKLILATGEHERQALQSLYQRGQENRVPKLRLIGADELREIEPHARGVAAIHSGETGIVDYREVVLAAANWIGNHGGSFSLSAEVLSLVDREDSVAIQTSKGDYEAAVVVSACGLHSDRVARLTTREVSVRVVPFRGEYYRLRPQSRHLVQHAIYPVPDPRFPFLGVHFTRTVHGEIEAGPNAVLAFAREGYRRRDVNFSDLWEMGSYVGFWRLGRRHWDVAAAEFYRSLSKRAFVRSLRRLIPELKTGDVESAGAGVRAMALKSDGTLYDDFFVHREGRIVHVLNAPSPAATSCFAIGQEICESVLD